MNAEPRGKPLRIPACIVEQVKQLDPIGIRVARRVGRYERSWSGFVYRARRERYRREHAL